MILSWLKEQGILKYSQELNRDKAKDITIKPFTDHLLCTRHCAGCFKCMVSNPPLSLLYQKMHSPHRVSFPKSHSWAVAKRVGTQVRLIQKQSGFKPGPLHCTGTQEETAGWKCGGGLCGHFVEDGHHLSGLNESFLQGRQGTRMDGLVRGQWWGLPCHTRSCQNKGAPASELAVSLISNCHGTGRRKRM